MISHEHRNVMTKYGIVNPVMTYRFRTTLKVDISVLYDIINMETDKNTAIYSWKLAPTTPGHNISLQFNPPLWL